VTANKQYYDNTKLGDYKKCPRYYYLRHVRGWRPAGTAMPLIFGLCWHEAMNVIWSGWKMVKENKATAQDLVEVAMTAWEHCWIENGGKPIAELDMQDLEMLGARTPMVAKEMLYSYVDKREGILNQMELLAAERPFAVPLYEDRTDIWYIGRRDKDVMIQGDLVVIEHKTSSEYKVDGGFKQQYLESYYPNSQVTGYLYAANLEYGKVRYVWVDAALVHKKVHDCFKFIPINSSLSDMDAWLWEARDWAARVENEIERLADQPLKNTVMGAFPKNTENCCGKYGLCSMLTICRGFSNPASLEEPPPQYIHDPWNPFELLHISEIEVKP